MTRVTFTLNNGDRPNVNADVTTAEELTDDDGAQMTMIYLPMPPGTHGGSQNVAARCTVGHALVVSRMTRYSHKSSPPDFRQRN